MQKKKNTKSANRSNFRFVDFLIIFLLLFIAFISVILFRFDLMQTFNSQNAMPVGTVVVKKNTVQRRLTERVLWDRLGNESPVYIGDLIRVADISAATLYIGDISLDLNENTLIRITLSPDGESVQISLTEGNLSLAAGEGSGGITLELNGNIIQAGSGTVLSASASESGGSTIQVSEGSAIVLSDEAGRELTPGTAAAFDSGGEEREIKTVVVTSPAPNARYINSIDDLLPVNFLWNRINLLPDDVLSLEIALDRNYTQVFRIIDNLSNEARIFLDPGLWYWRINLDDNAVSEGRFTIVNGTGPLLLSPAVSSVFRYTDESPVVNFQWAETAEAVSYVMEAATSPEFDDIRIQWQGSSVSYACSILSQGTWYWRVKAVFPVVYSGDSSFSQPSFFSIVYQPPGETEEAEEEISIEEWLSREMPPELIPVPPQLRLTSPVSGAGIAGLAALREQIVFSWECEAEVSGSRFVLSANPDPFADPGAIVILNPENTIRIDSLGGGVWYWNVEAQTVNGYTVRADESSRLQVLAIPLLPAPVNMQPANRFNFGINELRARSNINFSWQPVQGANAYIFTLYRQTAGGGRQRIASSTQTGTGYNLTNLGLLDRGTFVWQVEAVNRGRGNVIDQRGAVAEYIFTLDFPPPTPVEINDAGILYGR